MLRRAPTVLTITAEDVADYEDRRAAELQQQQQQQQTHLQNHIRTKKPPPNWAAYHRDPPSAGPATLESDSDDYAGAQDIEDDEDDDDNQPEAEEVEQDQSTMDIDGSSLAIPLSSSPAAARAMGRGAGGAGRGQARGPAAHGQARRGVVGQGPGLGQTAIPAAGVSTQAQAARAPVAGNVVTPETRPVRSREERIGVAQAPERRRR
ncbi:hypothetical protein BR93DRAFT_979193 [Coniochaeta sp. PMI_546]|nr:hypothetical protein BR93DRAFT_979193 [Coniochaeta sp. PMI_546]